MSKLKVDEIRSADRSVSSSANITLADDGNISTAGNISPTGNIVIANTKGIDFSAVSGSASGSSSALLDDYEEGTWTPNIGGSATYGTLSSDTYGRYQKVGNICHAQFKITQKTLGTGSQSLLQGFPFNSANLGTVQTGCCSFYSNIATNVDFLAFYIQNNTNSAYFVGTASAGSGVLNGINIFSNSASDTIVYGAISYFTE